MKFICKNKECDKFDIEDEYLNNTYKFINGKLRSNHAPCPCCGKIREEINPNKDIPLSQKNIDIAKYSSSSTEDKRAILKKRSHEHYEKDVKPFKEYQLHETVKKFKEASKG